MGSANENAVLDFDLDFLNEPEPTAVSVLGYKYLFQNQEGFAMLISFRYYIKNKFTRLLTIKTIYKSLHI